MRGSRPRRAALIGLGAVELAWGGWAYLAPRRFFADFPGFGHRWTGAYPPYNAHLVSDLGATFVTLGVLLVLAGLLDDRRVTRVVLTGVIVFNVLHLVFHALHHGALGSGDYAASLVSLVLGVAVPLGLLALTRR